MATVAEEFPLADAPSLDGAASVDGRSRAFSAPECAFVRPAPVPKHLKSDEDRNCDSYDYWHCAAHGRLTVKLRGRTEAPDTRRGRTLSFSACGAQPPTRHGPLQRWLDFNEPPPSRMELGSRTSVTVRKRRGRLGTQFL